MTRHTPGGRVPPGVWTRAFITLSATSLVTYFSVQLLVASLPLYAVQLGADDAVIGLMAGIIAVMSLTARPWVGWWLDRGGTIQALSAGVLLFVLSSVGYWVAASIIVLLIFRALTGVGVALFTTAGQSLTVDLAPPQRRGEALSLYAVSHPIAMIAGPPIGVSLAAALGYPGLFAVCIATGFLGLALIWPLRAVRAGRRGRVRPRLVNRAVLAPGIWMAVFMIGYGANVGLLAVHAARRGVANPGVVFTAIAVGLLAALLAVGRQSDRRGRTSVIVPGMALSAAGLWLTALAGGWALILAGTLTGIGLGLAQPALFALAVDLVPDGESGSALATLGLFLEIGIGLGAIGGGALARAIGTGAMFGVAGLAPTVGAALAAISAGVSPVVVSDGTPAIR